MGHSTLTTTSSRQERRATFSLERRSTIDCRLTTCAALLRCSCRSCFISLSMAASLSLAQASGNEMPLATGGGPDVGSPVPPSTPVPGRLRLPFVFLSKGITEVSGCFRLRVLLLLPLLLLPLLLLRRARPEDLRKEDPGIDPPACLPPPRPPPPHMPPDACFAWKPLRLVCARARSALVLVCATSPPPPPSSGPGSLSSSSCSSCSSCSSSGLG